MFAKLGTATTLKSASNVTISSSGSSATTKHLEAYIPYDGYYRVDCSITLTKNAAQGSNTSSMSLPPVHIAIYDEAVDQYSSHLVATLVDSGGASNLKQVGDEGTTYSLSFSNKNTGFLKAGTRVTLAVVCGSTSIAKYYTGKINSLTLKYTTQ